MATSLERKREILQQLRGGATLEQKRSILQELRDPIPQSGRDIVLRAIRKSREDAPLGGGEVNIPGAAASGGELIGRLVGAPLGPVGSAISGGAGAALTLGVSRLARGEKVSPGELAMEFGLSVLPDAVVPAVKRGAQRILSRSRPGIEKATQLGAERARDLPEELFKSKPQQEIDQLFDQMRATGTKLDAEDFRKPIQNLTDDSFRTIKEALGQIKAPPNKDVGQFREGTKQFFENLRTGGKAPGVDLGALNHVRSQLQKQAFRLGPNNAKAPVLFNFIDSIDEFMDNAKVVSGTPGGIELRKVATLESARAKFQDEFASFIENRVSRTTSSGRKQTLNLGNLERMLRRPETRSAERASKALEFIAKQGGNSKEEMLEFFENMKKVNLEPALLNKTGGLSAVFVDFLANIAGARPATRARFNRLVRDNDDTISRNIMALTINALRREEFEPAQIPGVFP